MSEQTSQASQNLSNSENQHLSEQEQESMMLATGLEDYAHWKIMFKDQKREDDKPFCRGRIWA
ncbi:MULTISPECIES: cyanobactin biosynthesis PatC/TenC/TruC family protein [Okeania]|uniref:Cyanobactin biosynthesis PatC/TenC/TruC family protein n=1 Tax=Okeania hirsuta TaxID=1458930 RepID=A0A3N6RJN1_9CYAN|nr:MULTISPECIES: cyanobactin biosynthesis PatC/TenC/TruC family protein [Okeania]NET13519.1 cyanobactin biosynthesis PatC/TenC/TruC family protein [Okeania sp. SIO1H6]NES77700.1 cyanobactin biosynthesis PatC/TenC/TruC family protein [Okeania sp. SIO1H4]NES89547.1 cyanobactin biosynthesis PatC/TenC/TruC family protein [Okeania sp. SIO2B9]NET21376.1 cyanobactin biosynthesis PatC/TenC/TruC family protein [Okeania sp. SIO1H5]NET78018.1 cyanobactin biosynthesis PatC/TenC/TruC family protein [Okeani